MTTENSKEGATCCICRVIVLLMMEEISPSTLDRIAPTSVGRNVFMNATVYQMVC